MVSKPIFSQQRSILNDSVYRSMNPSSGTNQLMINTPVPSRICHSDGNEQMIQKRIASSNMSSQEDVKPDLNNLNVKQEKLDLDDMQEIVANEGNRNVISSHGANNIKMEVKLEFKEEPIENGLNPALMKSDISSVRNQPRVKCESELNPKRPNRTTSKDATSEHS